MCERNFKSLFVLSFADVYTENPDEKSIITYVVAFYHYFSKMKALAVEGKRVGKVRVCLLILIHIMNTSQTCTKTACHFSGAGPCH